MVPPATTDRAVWVEALRLLDVALELPHEERQSWLDAQSDVTPAVHGLMTRLIAERHAIETGEFLAAAAVVPRTRDESPTDDDSTHDGGAFQDGQLVGPYRLIRLLGTGGMASVWLAARADQSHRRLIALKLPAVAGRAGWVARRFAIERSILSSLAHPNIASVLDAGSDGAQPWLAMEFFDGVPITRHCDAHSLDIPARLRLFLQVLAAVQHAHGQLVIHRDIKPSNVLVSATGHVKLLDFGVAKLLQSTDESADEATLTRESGRAMTPQYASPEQIAGRPLGTASDLYSLGVLLYRLLADQLPYVMRRDTPVALEEAIVKASVVPPSHRAVDRVWAKALRGDLDTIVMKALHAEPAQRYGSAESFGQDISRYLESQPILARRASFGYVLRKAVGRHTAVFAGAAALLLAIVVGVVGTLWQAQLARNQAERAEASQKFLIDLLALNDPQLAQGRALTARDLLDISAKRIDVDFADRPELQTELHVTVAALYDKLAVPSSSIAHTRRAIALYEARGLTKTNEYLDALYAETQQLQELNQPVEAEALARRGMAIAARLRGEPSVYSARWLASLSWTVGENGNLPLARQLAEKSMEAARAVEGERSDLYANAMSKVAGAMLDTGDLRGARDMFARQLALSEQIPGTSISDRLVNGYSLAHTDYRLGDSAAAERSLRTLVPQFDAHIGVQADRTIRAHALQAQVLGELGRFLEAVDVQRATLASVEGTIPPDPEIIAVQRVTLAKTLKLAARYDEGLPLARDGLKVLDAAYPAPRWMRDRARWVYGELLLGSGQREAGLTTLRTALRNIDAMPGSAAAPARAEVAISLAVAQRGGPGVDAAVATGAATAAEDACAVVALAQGPASVSSLRCSAIRIWLRALVSPMPERQSHADALHLARDAVVAKLPAGHPLGAELLAAEAEVRHGGAESQPAIIDLERRATRDFTSALGRPMPVRLAVLH